MSLRVVEPDAVLEVVVLAGDLEEQIVESIEVKVGHVECADRRLLWQGRCADGKRLNLLSVLIDEDGLDVTCGVQAE